MSVEKTKKQRDWAERIAENKRLYPKAVANNQAATNAFFKYAGGQAPKGKVKPSQRVYKTTNAEEAKRLKEQFPDANPPITARQVSKMRNGRKPFPKRSSEE